MTDYETSPIWQHMATMPLIPVVILKKKTLKKLAQPVWYSQAMIEKTENDVEYCQRLCLHHAVDRTLSVMRHFTSSREVPWRAKTHGEAASDIFVVRCFEILKDVRRH